MENTGNSKCDEGVKQAWQLHIAGGTQNGTATVERSVAVSEEANTHWPYSSGILLFGMHARDMKTYIHMKTCTQMFMATLFVTAQNVFVSWCMNKQNIV